MPVNPPAAATTPSSSAGDIITDALKEIQAIQAGETPSAEDMADGLRKLQRLIDSWQARRLLVWSVSFNDSFTLIPNHAPHTIGPQGADFNVAVRPVKVEYCNVILNTSTPNVRVPLTIRDDQWWAYNRVQGVSTSYPTDLFYSPDWPNGTLNLWPVPTAAWPIELVIWAQVTQVTKPTDSISMPPGYWDAMVYSLAVSLLPAYEKPPNPALGLLAQKAVAQIESNNAGSPIISTIDAGMPDTNRKRGDFNWLTGSMR